MLQAFFKSFWLVSRRQQLVFLEELFKLKITKSDDVGTLPYIILAVRWVQNCKLTNIWASQIDCTQNGLR